MERNMLKRYLILVAVLILCAGAAWLVTNGAHDPHENAVLAYKNTEEYRIAEACRRQEEPGREMLRAKEEQGAEAFRTGKPPEIETVRARKTPEEALQTRKAPEAEVRRWERWQMYSI